MGSKPSVAGHNKSRVPEENSSDHQCRDHEFTSLTEIHSSQTTATLGK